MNKAVLTLLLVGALAGCSLFSPKPADVVINEKPTIVICSATTQKPDALNLKDTPPTMVMDADEVWGYWFSSDLYGALAENLQAMRAYQMQQRAIRKQLVACIEDHNKTVPDEETPD